MKEFSKFFDWNGSGIVSCEKNLSKLERNATKYAQNIQERKFRERDEERLANKHAQNIQENVNLL